jgi:hypothetical protein
MHQEKLGQIVFQNLFKLVCVCVLLTLTFVYLDLSLYLFTLCHFEDQAPQHSSPLLIHEYFHSDKFTHLI